VHRSLANIPGLTPNHRGASARESVAAGRQVLGGSPVAVRAAMSASVVVWISAPSPGCHLAGAACATPGTATPHRAEALGLTPVRPSSPEMLICTIPPRRCRPAQNAVSANGLYGWTGCLLKDHRGSVAGQSAPAGPRHQRPRSEQNQHQSCDTAASLMPAQQRGFRAVRGARYSPGEAPSARAAAGLPVEPTGPAMPAWST
jgi:hypothetical protein